MGSGTFRLLSRSGLAFLKEGHGFVVFDVEMAAIAIAFATVECPHLCASAASLQLPLWLGVKDGKFVGEY